MGNCPDVVHVATMSRALEVWCCWHLGVYSFDIFGSSGNKFSEPWGKEKLMGLRNLSRHFVEGNGVRGGGGCKGFEGLRVDFVEK